MFSLFGIILIVFGLATKGQDIYARSLGFNINLLWGIVLLIFGVIMLVLAWRATPKKSS
jgi:uncharacterized membrane protein HdeD (DUF308 family)